MNFSSSYFKPLAATFALAGVLCFASTAQAVNWKNIHAKRIGAATLVTVQFEDNSKIGITPDKLYIDGNLGSKLNLKKQSVRTRSNCRNKFDPLVSCYTYTYLFKRIKHGIMLRGTLFHVMNGHWPHSIFPDEVSKHKFAIRL